MKIGDYPRVFSSQNWYFQCEYSLKMWRCLFWKWVFWVHTHTLPSIASIPTPHLYQQENTGLGSTIPIDDFIIIFLNDFHLLSLLLLFRSSSTSHDSGIMLWQYGTGKILLPDTSGPDEIHERVNKRAYNTRFLHANEPQSNSYGNQLLSNENNSDSHRWFWRYCAYAIQKHFRRV